MPDEEECKRKWVGLARYGGKTPEDFVKVVRSVIKKAWITEALTPNPHPYPYPHPHPHPHPHPYLTLTSPHLDPNNRMR